MQINVIRGDAGLWINPAPPYLLNYLQYTKRSFASKNYQKVDSFEKILLYSLDGSGGIFTLQGFYQKIIQLIKKNLDLPKIDDRRTRMPPIDWEAVKSVGLRDYQITPLIEFLPKAEQESGMFLGTGGFGKTFMMAATYAAWNNLNTILAIPYQEVTKKTYADFKRLFPNKHVGIFGGGMHDLSSDITITTFASLYNCALEKCQLLLIDELQGSTGDEIQTKLGAIKPIRTFGYTATPTGLFSKADKVLKGLFGEALVDIDYPMSIEMGAVVPCVVYFIKVPDTALPLSGNLEKKLKDGIMKHIVRNDLIGKVCKAVPNGWQTLIFVDQVKNHLMNLMPFLPPETKYVHRDASKDSVKEFALKPKEQDKNIRDFVNNEIQYLVATDCLRAGFDSQNCRVVIQASGGSSKIEILQEAFRGSRILPEERREKLGVEPKTYFILIDFWDQHEEVLLRMSEKRKEFYLEQGWKVNVIDNIKDINWLKYD